MAASTGAVLLAAALGEGGRCAIGLSWLPAPGHSQVTAAARTDVFAAERLTRRLLDRVGDKWSVLILLLMGDNDALFSSLTRRSGGISQKMLSQTLERDGLVSRAVTPSVPVAVTYSITPLARDLLASLRLMIDWAESRMQQVQAARDEYHQRF